MKTKTIKLTCLQIAFLFVSCGLDAQQQVTLTGFSNADTAIERYRGGFKFVGTNEKISKETLSQMFDENTFALYKQAHRKHVVANTLWGVSGTLLTVSALSLGWGGYANYVWNHDPRFKDPNQHHGTPLYPIILQFGYITLAAALVTASPAWGLTKDSHHKLENIAHNYNKQEGRLSLNMGLSLSGFGVVLNF